MESSPSKLISELIRIDAPPSIQALIPHLEQSNQMKLQLVPLTPKQMQFALMSNTLGYSRLIPCQMKTHPALSPMIQLCHITAQNTGNLAHIALTIEQKKPDLHKIFWTLLEQSLTLYFQSKQCHVNSNEYFQHWSTTAIMHSPIFSGEYTIHQRQQSKQNCEKATQSLINALMLGYTNWLPCHIPPIENSTHHFYTEIQHTTKVIIHALKQGSTTHSISLFIGTRKPTSHSISLRKIASMTHGQGLFRTQESYTLTDPETECIEEISPKNSWAKSLLDWFRVCFNACKDWVLKQIRSLLRNKKTKKINEAPQQKAMATPCKLSTSTKTAIKNEITLKAESSPISLGPFTQEKAH